MTLSEFRYWLDGFHHYFNEPNKEQWKLIKEKLDSIVVPPSITLGGGSGTLTSPPWQTGTILCTNAIASSRI